MELLHRRYGSADWVMGMSIVDAKRMLPIIYRKEFEDRAFMAWCAYGDGMSWGDYLRALDERNAPPKSREEIYGEIDKLFEGR